MFYIGVTIFLLITDWVQRPYLQFSAKRWGLITGLKGHLTSSFFLMGLKVVAPLAVTIGTWPLIRGKAFVALCPLLLGYLAQFALETYVDRQGSSCWPLVPIIFEVILHFNEFWSFLPIEFFPKGYLNFAWQVYRLYQLTRAGSVVEGLLVRISRVSATPALMQKQNALLAMSLTFYIVALVSLWSLLTFLMRLFPSRPVAVKYWSFLWYTW